MQEKIKDRLREPIRRNRPKFEPITAEGVPISKAPPIFVWREPENLTEEGHQIERLNELAKDSPELQATLRKKHQNMLYQWGKWVAKIVKPRIVGACARGQWVMTDDPERHGRAVVISADGPRTGLRVLITGNVEADGKRWIHLSVSKYKGVPSWEEVVTVKETFLGPDLVALQVFPPRSEWVNHHLNVLHLWACVDERPVPDFQLNSEVGEETYYSI